MINWSQANDGYIAFNVVTSIQAQNTANTTISRVHGIFFSSLEASIANIVVSATIIANGKFTEKPHASRCGFMKPSQVQTRMPIHGRLRMNGSEPNTRRVTAMSLMRCSSGQT